MKMPNVIYVYIDGDPGEEFLIATTEPGEKKDGIVGVYDLREKLNVRTKTQFKREGTKTWFDK